MFLSKTNVRRMAVVTMTVAALTTLCGCYDYGLLSSLLGGDLLGGGGLLSGAPIGTWPQVSIPVTPTTFPPTTLYDPTNDIQSVIDYRQQVMEDSASGWGDYILQ